MNRLEELLDKASKTDDEEMELDRLLQECAKENNITFTEEHGWQ